MALYYPPTNNSPIYVEQNFLNPNTPQTDGSGGGITEEFLNTNYLKFPNAQGVENFGFKELQLTSSNAGETATLFINPSSGQDVILETSQTDGSLAIQTPTQSIIISPSVGITFDDGTTQNTAYNDTTSVHVDQDNTFETGFTQTFDGDVVLGSSATALTQISGDSSTLVATTAFVQDAIQVSGVQVGDSPLLWSGQNTWQYNSGTPGTLPLTYKYGISNLWNLTNYAGDCDLVCNSGTGANSSAFNIYCVQGDSTGTDLRALTPQLTLSNNGTSAFLKDGLDVNNQNISNIGTLTIGNNTVNATINTYSVNGITTLSNINVNGGFTFNVNGGIGPTICNMVGSGFYIYNTLDMNNNNIANINTLSGNSTSAINVSSPISMNSGNAININNAPLNIYSGTEFSSIDQNNTLNQLTIYNNAPHTDNNANISFNLNIPSGGINVPNTVLQLFPNEIDIKTPLNMNNNDIINCNSITDTFGQFVTTSTPPDNTITTAIATTGYVATAIANIPASVSQYYISQIITTVGVNGPIGNWIFCNGQSLNAQANPIYQNLYNSIGNSYGGPDNSNFNVPNFQGRGMAGDTTFSGIASINNSTQGGASSFLLTNAPNHFHSNSINNSNFYDGYSQATNNLSGNYVVNQNSSKTPVTNSGGGNIGNPGGESIPTISPFIAVYYWIYGG